MGAAAIQHSFSGHETFPFRYPWLKKGFDAIRADPGAFNRDDATTTLGVGKNMVRAIRHWCLAAGVVAENRDAGGTLRPTDLGARLLDDDGLDPYLEDPATLWVLHWQIASNRARATTWYWAFSQFHEPEFTREALASALFSWTRRCRASWWRKGRFGATWRCSCAPTCRPARVRTSALRIRSIARSPTLA